MPESVFISKALAKEAYRNFIIIKEAFSQKIDFPLTLGVNFDINFEFAC